NFFLSLLVLRRSIWLGTTRANGGSRFVRLSVRDSFVAIDDLELNRAGRDVIAFRLFAVFQSRDVDRGRMRQLVLARDWRLEIRMPVLLAGARVLAESEVE